MEKPISSKEMNGRFDYIHWHLGSGGCGMGAFRLKRMFECGERLMSADVQHMDGSPMEEDASIVCDSCGRPFIPMVQNIEKEKVDDEEVQ